MPALTYADRESTRDIRLLSAATGKVVVVETRGVRERRDREPVHLKDDAEAKCDACGKFGGLWLDSGTAHAQHKARCA